MAVAAGVRGGVAAGVRGGVASPAEKPRGSPRRAGSGVVACVAAWRALIVNVAACAAAEKSHAEVCRLGRVCLGGVCGVLIASGGKSESGAEALHVGGGGRGGGVGILVRGGGRD